MLSAVVCCRRLFVDGNFFIKPIKLHRKKFRVIMRKHQDLHILQIK
jgi:hypothetical protein